MRVIESWIRGKRPDQSLCEDGIFIGSKIVAVIDGVTSHGEMRWNGGSSGKFAKDVICEYLSEYEGELALMSAEECMRRLSCALAKKTEEFHPGPKDLPEYPRASVILFNSVVREVWSYGDCQCMIGGELHREVKEVDRLLAELRAFVIESGMRETAGSAEHQVNAVRRAGAFDSLCATEMSQRVCPFDSVRDPGREAILPFISKQCWFENQPGMFGYPVLNGLNFAEEMVRVWPVPFGAEVVLASDGYPVLCSTLEESEERLREVIAEDPMCVGRNIGTKGIMEGTESYDDRVYVRIV